MPQQEQRESPRGPMDKAPAYGAGDSQFVPERGYPLDSGASIITVTSHPDTGLPLAQNFDWNVYSRQHFAVLSRDCPF